MIGSICDIPKVLEVMRIVNIVISVIRIAVPIILILSVMIKLTKAVYSPDQDELAKMGKVIVRNIIAAVLIFFIPTFVSVIVDIVAPDSEYRKCIEIKSLEEIHNINNDNAEELIRKAEETKNINDYTTANNYLVNVKDSNKKAEYESRLKSVKDTIDESNKKKEEEEKAKKDPATTDASGIKSYILYLGDSRIEAYINYKTYMGFDGSNEAIYATTAAGYDDRFRNNMTDALRKMNSDTSRTYAVTVNYGVNAKGAYKKFCDYYDDYLKKMDKKNLFIIVSVNPIYESKVRYNVSSNTNANVMIFNNYMKETCVNQLRTNNPGSKVYYCDVYGSMSVSDWIHHNYIAVGDGIHYTKDGSKYIYEYTRKCVAAYE